MELKKHILIINILLIGILILYCISELGIISLTSSGIVIFSAWVALMNNLGLTLSKTLVLLIFPVVFIGIANNSKMERDQKIIIGKIGSFASIILLIVANFLDVTFYFYAPYPETGRLLIFIFMNFLSLVLYILIYIVLKIKTE